LFSFCLNTSDVAPAAQRFGTVSVFCVLSGKDSALFLNMAIMVKGESGELNSDVSRSRGPAESTIRVLDDDPQIRRLIHRQLAAEGFEIELAGDGYQALRVLLKIDCPELKALARVVLSNQEREEYAIGTQFLSVTFKNHAGTFVSVTG
jgi:hypothetical protein